MSHEGPDVINHIRRKLEVFGQKSEGKHSILYCYLKKKIRKKKEESNNVNFNILTERNAYQNQCPLSWNYQEATLRYVMVKPAQGCVPTQTPFLHRNLYGVGQNLREDVPDKLKWGSRNPVSALLKFSCEGLIYDEGHANHI